MSEKFDQLTSQHISFIEQQHIYFVGTAGADGFVNVSPKGTDSLRVVNPTEVLWLNLTGSGNETAAHLQEQARMTIMFCSFDKQPLILRLYGNAETIHPRDEAWQSLIKQFPEDPGARQIFRLNVQLVQTSCGFAVPHYAYQGDRKTLQNWSQGKGKAGIEEYWQAKNTRSLDGKDTGVLNNI